MHKFPRNVYARCRLAGGHSAEPSLATGAALELLPAAPSCALPSSELWPAGSSKSRPTWQWARFSPVSDSHTSLAVPRLNAAHTPLAREAGRGRGPLRSNGRVRGIPVTLISTRSILARL